jgi:outer membrane protein assembly factor BamB
MLAGVIVAASSRRRGFRTKGERTVTITLDQVVFIGFNNRVVALDQNTGQLVWEWRCPTGSGYVSVLLTDDRHLIVSVSGYTYCLDPATGQQIWFNELKGFGTGVASLTAWGGSSATYPTIPAAEEEAAAAHAATTTST